MIFENYSQSNVFVTGENLVRRMRWLRRKKKKKGRNILWGKKAINFFWKSIFFFPPPPPHPRYTTKKRKNEVCRFGSQVFYIQSWPRCFRVTSKVLHFYFVSFPSFDFFRIPHATRSVCSSIVREFEFPRHNLILSPNSIHSLHSNTLCTTVLYRCCSIIGENFKLQWSDASNQKSTPFDLVYFLIRNFYQHTKSIGRNIVKNC